MLVTEIEARMTFCPNRIEGHPLDRKCVGSMCMAWRWLDKFETKQVDGHTFTLPLPPRRGYCGLAGVPEEA